MNQFSGFLRQGFLWTVLPLFVIGVAAVSAPLAQEVSGSGGSSQGTKQHGQSGSFEEYLNEPFASREANSVELIRWDEDSNVSVGGEEDPEVALKMAY